MRVSRDDWAKLNPADVAWVAEWQLAAAFPWVPRGEESPVTAAPFPEPGGRFWKVSVRAGHSYVPALLPLRDLARVIGWCHQADWPDLYSPPAPIRGNLRALRGALRQALTGLDPLGTMGYASGPPEEAR